MFFAFLFGGMITAALWLIFMEWDDRRIKADERQQQFLRYTKMHQIQDEFHRWEQSIGLPGNQTQIHRSKD